MREILAYIVAGAFAVLTVTGPMSASGQAPPVPQAESVYTPEQLDQLLAPIALYPDVLLGQILMAATYPLEVVQAARWVREPDNAALKGDALTAALAGKDWDPSVKSLVPFPQVLQMMDTHLDWMQRLGDAFLAQQGDVMTAVQRLRIRAKVAGTLISSAQQVVVPQGRTIVIEPANPEVIYVPVYNPGVIFGPWPYPAYPPYYFPPPPGYVVEPSLITGFYFAAGIITVQWLWGWDHFDWHRRRIDIDVHRFNVINVHRPPVTHNIWVHDRYHRRGVPYPSPGVRARFGRVRAAPFDMRRDFRGYDRTQGVTPPRVTPPGGRVPRAAPPQGAAAPRTLPPAFEGYSNGTEVRRDAERGRESRGTMPPEGLAPPRRIAPSRGESRGNRGSRPGGERRR